MYGYDNDKKKYKHKSEFDKPLPCPTFMTSEKPKGYCERMPGVLLKCEYGGRCWLCEYADRVRLNLGSDPPPHPMIDVRSVLPENAKKQLNYYGKVVALRPEALERLGFKQLLYFQFFKCVDGFGCLPGNDVWEIDGYLLANKNKPITLRRLDIIGIPTFTACERYDKCFFANSVKECGYSEGGGVI